MEHVIMGDTLRFIHSADLHLDSLFKSKSHLPERLLKQMRSSTFEAFDRLIDQALYYDVDFVLIVGDLFNESIRSLKAQVHLRDGFKKLCKKGIPVYVSHGNHDYVKGNRYPIDYPENVHVFQTEEVERFSYWKGGIHKANLYGFSFENRAVRERKVQEYRKEEDPMFHIALLHGSLETNTDHDVYAPFKMEELYERNMDYWALGHIHQRQTLSHLPPVVYPGNIQGRSRKESGEKGCYLVEHNGEEWNLTFLPLQSFVYEEVTVSCEGVSSPKDLESIFENAKQQISHTNSSVVLSVELVSSSGILNKWDSEGILEEWVEIVNEGENFEEEWIWIDRVMISEQPVWDEEELIRSQHFAGELVKGADEVTEEEIEEWISPLFQHRKASKYLSVLTKEEMKEVKEDAKRVAIEQLLMREDNHS
ncbi:DNA repair exonuclease [Halobacillus yeomjeoni]|uniref:metallophosphoesterase family protein n=1 Tax=Halobacillus yeomjeoni TaxID=311194 RepID=UPI001CD2D445|nr:DNA repair exonuclease [Halobacillus yeomjeoni]MCA0983898.1 DNA repair exonuclease [Halobacillus yeomjeoni]